MGNGWMEKSMVESIEDKNHGPLIVMAAWPLLNRCVDRAASGSFGKRPAVSIDFMKSNDAAFAGDSNVLCPSLSKKPPPNPKSHGMWK